MQLRFHTQTAGVSLTAQQPEVNVARVALEALSGVLGGTQSLHTDSFDEALALPTEHAARIALRTQQVIAHETGAALVADPLGGSWYVEALTDEVEARAEEVFAQLDEWGGGSIFEGVLAGIDNNWFQGQIAESAYQHERAMLDGDRIVVGVNQFTEREEGDVVPILSVGPAVEDQQRKRLATVRGSRDDAAVAESLATVRAAAAEPATNMMPAIIDAVRTYATLGEIMATMGEVFGTWAERPAV